MWVRSRQLIGASGMTEWLNSGFPVNVQRKGHVRSAEFTQPIVLDS